MKKQEREIYITLAGLVSNEIRDRMEQSNRREALLNDRNNL